MFSQILLAALVASQQGIAPPCTNADTTDIAAFISHFVSALPPTERVPRGAFVLVCGGHVRLTHGFGRAANGDSVDPERTLFRAASNSKLITATAAMQLAGAGRWKLSDDVNRYLPTEAKLKDGFGRSVTIADLLTHTAGFEDKFSGSIALVSERRSLAEFFARNVPKRVRSAGEEVSYSNVGIALAGYAVEVASRESFTDYATRHVFAPLGMTRSTFAQPLPAAFLKDIASEPPRAAREIAFLPYPSASLVTTPSDMGRFIAAHLSGGATQSGRILSTDATREMHASHWRAQPSVPGSAYGFFEGEINGRRTLFHTGDSGDHSVVFLLPDDATGFYFVYTGTDEQTVVRERFTKEFMDRYYPRQVTASTTSASAKSAANLAGVYRGAAYSHSNYEKLKALFYQVSVHNGADGRLEIVPPGGGLVRLIARAPLVFKGDSGEVVAFRTDARGAATGFTLSGSIWDPQSFDRVSTLEDGRVHLGAFIAIAIAFLCRVLFRPIAAIGRKVLHLPTPSLSIDERNWWRWSGIVSAMPLLTPIIGLGVAFLSFRPGAVAVPRAAFVVGIWLTAICIAGLTLVPGAAIVWRRKLITRARRISLTTVAVGFVVGTPLLFYWRVLPLGF